MIHFHAKKNKNDSNPTHTLGFEKWQNAILMTYAKPNNYYDSYSKKEGTRIVTGRINKLKSKLKNATLATLLCKSKDSALIEVPHCVRPTLSFYLEKVCKIFKINHAEVSIILHKNLPFKFIYNRKDSNNIK